MPFSDVPIHCKFSILDPRYFNSVWTKTDYDTAEPEGHPVGAKDVWFAADEEVCPLLDDDEIIP